jgi:DNA-binding NarL/FixJ family response regulator
VHDINLETNAMIFTVALIDDHQLFLDGLRAVLATQPDLRVVAATSQPRTAARLVEDAQPDVVVLDMMMPGLSGVSVARELLRADPGRHVLALSMVADHSSVADALDAGVRGYACKSQPAADVVAAIREVARGNSYLAPQLSELAVPLRGARAPRPLDKLTVREREVFELTVSGRSTRDVAAELGISPRTVETHRARILRKLDAHSALDLVRLAASWGMLDKPGPA